MIPNFNDVRFEVTDKEKFFSVYNEFYDQVFEPDFDLSLETALSNHERMQREALGHNLANAYQLYLLMYEEERLLGWTYGRQVSAEEFYMVNTGIMKDYRRKGLYSHLLMHLLPIFESQGFQLVSSKHIMTNNAVIIPKLKAGFVISGLEVSDVHGSLIKLSYFFNSTRRKAMDFRSGLGVPEKHILDHFPSLD